MFKSYFQSLFEKKLFENFSLSASLDRFDSEGCVGDLVWRTEFLPSHKLLQIAVIRYITELLHSWSPTLDFFSKIFFFDYYHQIVCKGFLHGFHMIGNYFQSFFSKNFFFEYYHRITCNDFLNGFYMFRNYFQPFFWEKNLRKLFHRLRLFNALILKVV